MLYHLKKYLSFNNLKLVYHALIKSRLQYGIILWGNANQSALKNLNKMHNRAIRYISMQPYRTRLNKLYAFSKPGWSNFCTLHFSKLFEFAGLSRLKIPIFVPKSGCSLKKKKVFTWNRSAKFLFSFQNQVFSKKKKKRSSLGIGLQNSYFGAKS